MWIEWNEPLITFSSCLVIIRGGGEGVKNQLETGYRKNLLCGVWLGMRLCSSHQQLAGTIVGVIHG